MGMCWCLPGWWRLVVFKYIILVLHFTSSVLWYGVVCGAPYVHCMHLFMWDFGTNEIMYISIM